MIVVDSNVVAYLYLPGEYTDAAESLLEHDFEWAVPILWRSEFRNILAGYLRKRLLPFDEAVAIQREAENLLEGLEFNVASEGVLELVRGSDCSAYDCEFIELARELDTKLITMDKKLLRAFPEIAVSLA